MSKTFTTAVAAVSWIVQYCGLWAGMDGDQTNALYDDIEETGQAIWTTPEGVRLCAIVTPDA